MRSARLMQALRQQAPGDLAFDGVGGPRGLGLQSLFPMEELAPGSVAEMLPRLPRLWRRLAQAAHEVDRRRTDLVLTIGSVLLAPAAPSRRQARGAGALRRPADMRGGTTAARLARDLDHLLALLPFEPALFQRYGVPCSFVGHPSSKKCRQPPMAARFRRRYELPADAPLLCLLPGSKESEIGPICWCSRRRWP